jgi:uncharacterized protein YgiM (DUF1202 family)
MSKIGIFTLAFGLVLSLAASFNAQAGGGRPHQNFGAPSQCAPLQSGTPAYIDCMAYVKGQGSMKTVNTDTQLKSQPNSSSSAVGVLNKGTQIAVLDKTANGFWYHVQSGGFSGYLPFEVVN